VWQEPAGWAPLRAIPAERSRKLQGCRRECGAIAGVRCSPPQPRGAPLQLSAFQGLQQQGPWRQHIQLGRKTTPQAVLSRRQTRFAGRVAMGPEADGGMRMDGTT